MSPQKLTQAFLHNDFKYIKVELEANVLPEDYNETVSCSECDRGRVECSQCEGGGLVDNECQECSGTGIDSDEQSQTDETCSTCDGVGAIREDCNSCEGRGYHNCDYCSEGYIDDYDWTDRYCCDFEQHFKEKLDGIDKCFKFFRVYHDGSVDTECTFTLRVDYIDKLPAIVQKFKETCKFFGICETFNAGLHITLLEGYIYPRTKKLPAEKLSNYKTHVSKLLLGLLYLGSDGDVTRGFHCRDIRISDTDKYSAIYTHDDTCLEYRLFDTCYDHPERILQYLSLMAKTLRYYTENPRKSVTIAAGMNCERSNKMLKKHHHGGYIKLVDVFKSRESRSRLFTELPYLVNDRARRVLADISRLNPCQMSPEIFTVIKLFQ